MARSEYVQRRLAEIQRPMTPSQQKALQMLRDDRRRDLYEAADRRNTKIGCGLYYVTYSGGDSPELTKADIDALIFQGHIKQKYPDLSGLYVLAR